MTFPFENDTSAIMKRLAKADLKTHKLKTLLSGIVIVLATSLMAVVFMVLVNDSLSRANSTPYHAMYQAVDAETKELLLNDSDFEAVGIYKQFGGTADSDGIITIAYMNSVSMDLLGFRLLSGSYPVASGEAAVSAAYMKLHQLSIGDTFDFSYTDRLTNQQRQHRFTICGMIENKDQEAADQFYVLTSDEFRITAARQAGSAAPSSFSTQTPASVDVLLKLNAEKSGFPAAMQEEFLKAKGAALGIKEYDILLNTRYIEGFSLDTTVLISIVFFTAFLMFASSFVIYSIFYISVVNSIQMYAQMMSLGTTGKQLHIFLKRQGNILSLCFIPPGMALSLAVTFLISGTEWFLYDIAIALLSGLLIDIVIKAALQKPRKILASLSPIEGMKETGAQIKGRRRALKKITPTTLAKNNLTANRKKNRMAVVSLSISGTLMIALAILITSLNLPARLLEDYPVNEDFQIGVQIDNFYERFPQVIRANPLSDELVAEISSIPGVEKIIKDKAVIGRILEPDIADDTGDNTELIESLSPELLNNIREVVSGSADYHDMGMDGIIINKLRVDHSSLNYGQIKTGDTVRFQFETDGEISERTFRVIGIAYFPSTGLFYASPEVIDSISPFNNTSHLSVVCTDNSIDAVKETLQGIISRNPNLTLHTYAEDYRMFESFIGAAMGSLFGISAFVIVFGFINMTNMLINSALVRKQEFALLQAVGMTTTQLRKMLYREGLNISVKSVVIATGCGIFAGRLLCYLANEVLSLKFIIFTVNIWSVVLFAVTLVGLQVLVSSLICRAVEKDTLTERLRAE